MTDTESTVRAIAMRMAAAGWRLATAESCTGGLVAKACTDQAGSSAWFERGLVTYSNAAKQDLLGVPAALIERHGAVSQECATAMAGGLMARTPADWGVAITGIAGPGGGSDEKPVGLVWVAWAGRSRAVECERLQLGGGRQDIRAAAADAALRGLLARLGNH